MPQTVSAHSETKGYDWYFKQNDNHTQPIIFENKDFPNKYGTLSLGSPDEKVVYLTFDSGYINENVLKILDILKEQNVPGAFFILPHLILKSTDVVKRMIEDGHIVANHTYSHRDMSKVTDKAAFLKELTDLEALYTEYTGKEMAKYYRPPSGRFSEQNLKYSYEAGYYPTFWSFAYHDWDNDNQKEPEWAKKKILDNVHNGMVMLLHPNSATNAAILSEVIDELKEQGYRFGTLDELRDYNISKNAG